MNWKVGVSGSWKCVLHHSDDFFFLHKLLSFLIGKQSSSKMIGRLVHFDYHERQIMFCLLYRDSVQVAMASHNDVVTLSQGSRFMIAVLRRFL